MNTNADSDESRTLRARLARELVASGELTDAAWLAAVEEVPREVFVPGFFRANGVVDGLTRWEPVTADSDRRGWLEAVYGDTTLITQFDGRATDWGDRASRVGGRFTSSSTLPSLVVRMWQDAEIEDGQAVLEVGTGTGYSTALACRRLGDEFITSVDVDGAVLDQAARALRALGRHPWLATADGLCGYWPAAPYERIVAACSVRRIPAAWLRQTAPGGRILATLGGWGDGYARVLLTVDGDRARGRLLPGTVSFMPARRDAAPAPGNPFHWAMSARKDKSASCRGTGLAPTFYDEAAESAFHARFIAQLAVPWAQLVDPVACSAGSVFLVDTTTGSTAVVEPRGDGWSVTQAGPVRLWDAVERAVGAWRAAGEFAMGEFDVVVCGDEQRVRHGPSGMDFALPFA